MKDEVKLRLVTKLTPAQRKAERARLVSRILDIQAEQLDGKIKKA